MPTFTLFPTGSLNRDSDLNTLPKGDYSDARNIIVSTGKNGGKDTIKVLESIKNIGLLPKTGTFKYAHKASDGKIYLLYRTDSTNASIYVVPSTLDSITTVLTYAHGVSIDFDPDLKVIGDNIIWNYYGSGKLLYWLTTRSNNVTPLITDLIFAKSPPINVMSITKTVTTNQGVDFLELNDIQFASRYKYDNGEYSVLSQYTEMFKGTKDTASYTFVFNNTNRPTYASKIEVYCRIGSYGTWRRILTASVATVPSNLVWKGQFFETLSDEESNQTFSAVPDVVGNIEVAIDRVFIADYVDDYTNDSVGSITLGTSTGYTLPTGGTIKNYFGADTTTAGVNSDETGTYYKPFANNSQYSMGLLIYDSALKTRGVEFTSTFNTGLFTTSIAPVITINTSGYTKPSYAKWAQLCLTRNLSKSNTFEGFANSIYFDIEYETTVASTNTTTKEVKSKLSVSSTDVSKVKHMVIDISGLYKAGHIYYFNQGDRILISVPDGVATTTDIDGSQTGAYRVLDMEVAYGDSQKIYCLWTGGECLNDGIPVASKLYFEIYSVKQEQEEINTLFYAIGDMIDISSSIPSSITNYKLGDCVFKKIEFSEYTDQILQKGYTRSVPASIISDADTFVKSTKISSNTDTLKSFDLLSAQDSGVLNFEYYAVLDAFGASNSDGGIIANGNFYPKGFYDSLKSISFHNLLDFDNPVGVNDGEFYRMMFFTKIVKRSFDQAKQSFGNYTDLTDPIIVYSQTIDREDTGEYTLIEDIQMTLKPNAIIESGDEVRILFFGEMYLSGQGALNSGVLNIKNRNGYTTGVSMYMVGDRTAPADAYFPKDSVSVSVSKTQFVVRAISNAQQVVGWNTSLGKAYLRASDKVSSRRINAIRSSGNIIYGTEVNNIGQFSVMDTIEVPIENGRIMSLQRASRIQGDGDMLLAICENETSYILLGESSTNQSSNTEFRVLTSGIIGSVRNIGMRTGIQDRKSVFNYDGDIYWWDNSKSIVCQYTKKGLNIISDLNMKSDFLSKNGNATMAIDPFHKVLFISINSGISAGYKIDEGKWIGYFDISFDGSLNYGDRALFFKNGLIYRSLENGSSNKYGEFFGSVYTAYIKMTANTIIPIIPLNVVIGHNMNVIDYGQPNKVKSSLLDVNITNENGQETDIKEVNFLIEDNKLFGHVMRDKNNGGIVNGRFIKGYTNNFKLTLKDMTQENRIFETEISFEQVTGH